MHFPRCCFVLVSRDTLVCLCVWLYRARVLQVWPHYSRSLTLDNVLIQHRPILRRVTRKRARSACSNGTRTSSGTHHPPITTHVIELEFVAPTRDAHYLYTTAPIERRAISNPRRKARVVCDHIRHRPTLIVVRHRHPCGIAAALYRCTRMGVN